MFTHSIRWRLQMWVGFLLICVLSGFALAVYELHRINQFRDLDEELERRVAILTEVVRGRPPMGRPPDRPPFDRDGLTRGPGDVDGPRPPPDNGEPPRRRDGPGEMRNRRRKIQVPEPVMALFEQSGSDPFYFAIWSPDNHLLKSSTNAPAALPIPDHPPDSLTHTRSWGEMREALHVTELGDCVLVGRSIAADLRASNRFAWLLAGAGLGVLALGLGVGWGLVSAAIRPVEDISAAAARIADGNLAERIPVAEEASELGQLAGVLNLTFARLESAFAQQRQFTADASHELRTPLAVIISEAQTTLARERSADEYRETVSGCLETAQEMRRLTDSLLQLARFDAGQNSVERARFDLGEQAEACLGKLRRLAAEAGLTIRSELGSAMVNANADHLQQVMANLVANAIQYSKPGGEIIVSTRAENGSAVLTVEDHGLGISETDLPHIFERFYRADKARSAANGHSGLGLAICKAVLDANGGTIQVTSKLGSETKFTVRLPLSPDGAEDAS